MRIGEEKTDYVALAKIARHYRKYPIPANGLVWNVLQSPVFIDCGFQMYYLYAPYLLDFYSNKIKLSIEIIDCSNQEELDYFLELSEYLVQRDIRILCFSMDEVNLNVLSMIEKLKAACGIHYLNDGQAGKY